MANIFKPNKYQTFGLLKKHNIAKPGLPIINSVFEKVWFTIKGRLPSALA